MFPGYQRISTISALILIGLIAVVCVVVALAGAATERADGLSDPAPAAASANR